MERSLGMTSSADEDPVLVTVDEPHLVDTDPVIVRPLAEEIVLSRRGRQDFDEQARRRPLGPANLHRTVPAYSPAAR